jgi:hypothetical protein
MCLDAELVRDLLGRLRGVFVRSGAAAGDHLQAGKGREVAPHLISDTIGE